MLISYFVGAMENNPSKTIEVLNSLNLADLDGLSRFIHLNAPGIRDSVNQLLEAYSESRTNHVSMDWSRQQVHQQLFGSQPFNDKTIRYLLSDLHSQTLQYIGYLEVRNDQHTFQTLISDGLAKRGCVRSYSAHLNNQKKKLSSESALSPDAYFGQYQLGIIEAEWQLTHGTRSAGEMDDVLEHLDRFYLVKKLQLCCEALNASNVLAKEQELFMLDELIWQIHNSNFSEVPHIAIYLKIIDTLRQPDDESHFTRLTSLLQAHGDRIEQDDLRDMYHYVLNYSIKMINQGDSVHREVLLDNYKQMMAQKILIQDGQISQWTYKNVVTICLRQDETDFANTFIHTYRKFLSPDIRENAFQYNVAHLLFAKGQYKGAISGLQKVDLDDVYYRLDARSILLKSYYELNDIDAMFYQASSFRMFIRRNKSISAYQKTVYLNLIKITLALVRAGTNKTRLKRVRNRVERDSRNADIQWVESKLEELGA
ncbi:MAG: hypothetical protein ACI85F_000973 [Bacteroidia bacterium]|jgi:hypothetical protein